MGKVANLNNKQLTIQECLDSAKTVAADGDYTGAMIFLVGKNGRTPIFVSKGSEIDAMMTALAMAQRALLNTLEEEA